MPANVRARDVPGEGRVLARVTPQNGCTGLDRPVDPRELRRPRPRHARYGAATGGDGPGGRPRTVHVLFRLGYAWTHARRAAGSEKALAAAPGCLRGSGHAR